MRRALVLLSCLLVVGSMTYLASTSAVAATQNIFAVTTGNDLVQFSSDTPGTIDETTPITGLDLGELVLGIDFRPSTGQLYALGSNDHLYTINTTTGAASPVGAPGSFTLDGAEFGFDFNPAVDRIRVVSDNDQNIRLNPDTGTLAAADTSLSYAGGDPFAGTDPEETAVGYSNNFAGASSTTLFGIDTGTNTLITQNPPNSGTLNTVGSLGINPASLAGLDIVTDGGTDKAFAALTTDGTVSDLYTVNLGTGAVSLVGPIGPTPTQVRDITVEPADEPEPETPVNVFGVTSGNDLIQFSSATPEIIDDSTPITGLAFGELVLAIDFRPATGQLYALVSTSRLYTIDTSSGAATPVGAPGGFTLDGALFGFDFNPVVDRIRIVSNANQNLRVNPDTGVVAASDSPLSYAGGDPNAGADPEEQAVGYTNNFAGAASTTLFGIDTGTDALVTQNPPNAGILNTVGSLGIDPTGPAGLDIITDEGTDRAFAVLPTSVHASAFYTVNLATGAVTLVGPIGSTGTQVRDITVGAGTSPGNQPPVNTVPGPQETEKKKLVFSQATGNAISVDDPDGPDEPLRISLGVGDDVLTLATTNGLTFMGGDGKDDTFMLFSGSESAINAALDGLLWEDKHGHKEPATLQITSTDGDDNHDIDLVNITVVKK